MNSNPENDPNQPAAQYGSLLQAYVIAPAEPLREQAYQLAHSAIAHGQGLLDIVVVYHEALFTMLASAKTARESQEITTRASEFLLDSLAPFEMTHRGYQETIQRLVVANEALTRSEAELEKRVGERTAELARANEDLRAEIVERRRAQGERDRLLKRLQTQNESLVAQSEEIQANNEEIRVINEELIRATLAAQEAVMERDEFLSVAAHELKTPVTSLRGYAQVVLRELEKTGVPDPEHLRIALGQVDRQSTRLTNLVNQLLDISRLDAGKLVLEKAEADVSALVEGAVVTARRIYPHRTFVLDERGPLMAVVDALRLEQVITNLLDNAVRFSPKDKPIEVSMGKDAGGTLRIEVRDHGPGIPPEKRPHIFERFYQAHEGEWRGGMGLGLFVSREIVELHGGTISVECPEDGGSRFTVQLPDVP